jgi:hypothetical protein
VTAEPPPASGEAGSGTPALLAMVLVAALAGGACAALLARRRRKDDGGRAGSRQALAMVVPAAMRRGAPLLTSPAAPDVAHAADNRRRPPDGGGKTPDRGPPPIRAVPDPPPPGPSSGTSPPDPTIAWTAEIDWREKDGAGRFRVIATARDGRTAVVGRSTWLEWPPSSPDAVEALTAAADRLEASLVKAGWRTLAPGPSWYARRFGWEPARTAARPPEAPGGSGRFRRARPWPSGTEERWRCEITWHAGYVSSYFEATMYAPGRKRGKPIGASERFKWLLMGEPEPSHAEHVREARRLAAALRDAGWKRLDHGAAWYAARFVWPGEGAPPEQLERAPEIEGGTR